MKDGMQHSMNLDIKIEDSTAIKCPKCTGTTFVMVYLLREISKIITGGPRPLTVPIPIWKCDKCGNLLNRDLPAGIGTPEEILGIDNVPESKLLGQSESTKNQKIFKID